jgi:hypothetical protein
VTAVFEPGAIETGVIATWRRAAEAGNAALARTAFADDAVLISPLTTQFRFEGGDAIEELLEDVFQVLTDIRYTDQITDGDRIALFAEGRLGDRFLEEAQRIRLGADGLIQEITVFARPIPALTALLRGLGPRVARRQGKPGIARVLGVAGAVLDGMASSGDARFIPLARPRGASGP